MIWLLGCVGSAPTVPPTDSPSAATGPCAQYAEPVQMGVIADAALTEISGMVVSRRNPDVLWVHQDELAVLTAISTTGATLATVTLPAATNVDWEALASGPCGEETCLWIGEIGNNSGTREGLGVYRLIEPAALDAQATADFFGFTYPDGNHNSEAMWMDDQGRPVILTKRYDDATTHVYRYPELRDGVILEAVGVVPSGSADDGFGAAVTAADLWPTGERAIVRTYTGVFELDLSGGDITTAAWTAVVGAAEPQGEAIAYDAGRRGFWQVSEGTQPPLWFTGCL